MGTPFCSCTGTDPGPRGRLLSVRREPSGLGMLTGRPVRSQSTMSIRSSLSSAILLLTAASQFVPAQSGRLDPRSTLHITLPEDSPVTVVSADWGESTATARGGAMLLDLHTSLSLRNSGSRRIRSITLLVQAQEVTPGGKASVSV